MGKEILVIEDDDSLNRAVCLKLSKEGYTVYSAASVGEAENQWRLHEVSLIICDIDLPDGSGLALCAKLRQESSVVFLFLTAMSTEVDMMKGYAVGADDYITKPFFLPVLISKVNAIMRRVPRESETKTIVSGAVTLFPAEMRASKDGEYLNLTAKEYNLLSFFMKNPMRILSRNQLLEAIWDIDETFVDENTLAVNISRLRKKIEDNPSEPEYLKNVRGLGYIWEKRCSEEVLPERSGV